VLHLRRFVPLETLEEHERSLVEALFYDGGERTDTTSIREHYKEQGFVPESKIASALTRRPRTGTRALLLTRSGHTLPAGGGAC
jgi:hypothetical protein